MIHLDRNPVSLDASSSMLPSEHSLMPWAVPEADFAAGPSTQATPSISRPPSRPSGPSSPSRPPEGQSSTPTLPHSAAQTPAPNPSEPHSTPLEQPDPPESVSLPNGTETATTDALPDKSSPQSTPLSEVPDDFESTEVKKQDSSANGTENTPVNGAPSPSRDGLQTASSVKPATTAPPAPSIESGGTPSTQSAGSPQADPKVSAILELNAELFKVCMEFQARHTPSTDMKYSQYTTRLQSNISWLATVMDPSKPPPLSLFPSMEAPTPVDFYPMERIQEIYRDLPTTFAAAIAKRQALLSSLNNLKRERPDESTVDGMNKRRNTGEIKAETPLTPVPTSSIATTPSMGHLPSGITNGSVNGMTAQSPESTTSPPSVSPMPNTTPQMARSAQIRPPSRSRQISQQPNALNQSVANQFPNNTNASTNGVSQVPLQNQLYQILQNPSHPFVQFMLSKVPNFQSMSPQQQVQKMMAIQGQVQQARQDQIQQQRGVANRMANGPMHNISANQFPNQSPISPTQQSPQSPQNMMAMANNSGNMPGNPNAGNVNMQRQFMLMQQQQQQARGNIGNPNGMMNPQQMAYPQQERMRLEQQQRMGQTGAMQQPGPSMMPANDGYPALRSNAAIPGIARSARSPSEPGPSPMTPRMGSRPPSLGQDDYQRMMMMGQPMGTGFSQSPQGGNWTQGQGMQPITQNSGQMFSGQNGGGNFGMSQSPTNQNWAQSGGAYPYSNAMGNQHMSGTPGPQMAMQNGPGIDHSMPSEYDMFSWSGGQ